MQVGPQVGLYRSASANGSFAFFTHIENGYMGIDSTGYQNAQRDAEAGVSDRAGALQCEGSYYNSRHTSS